MKTITTTVYNFQELSDEAKARAIDNNRGINVDHAEWYDFSIDDLKAIGATIGIDIDNIFFSGFGSQGDGACFEGEYIYKKGGLARLKKDYPTLTEVHTIAENLQSIQARSFYGIYASVCHRGRYYHENCTDIDVSLTSARTGDEIELRADIDQEIQEELRDFMRFIYSRLNNEYDWLVSDESIKEALISNEVEFLSHGVAA
jgi:hypothetical protein